jgi:DNA invertase Pin-like site-specific DNA recombinase
VGLVSATEHVDTTTPSGRLHFQMLGSFSEFERASIKQRTLDGLHRAHRKGRYMGPVPLGYRADEDGRLEIVPEEAEIVREIISNIAAGSTLYSEAARLNALDIRPPSWKYASDKKSPLQNGGALRRDPDYRPSDSLQRSPQGHTVYRRGRRAEGPGDSRA